MLVVQGSGDYKRSYAFITKIDGALILHASKPYNNYSFICQYSNTGGGKFLEDWLHSVVAQNKCRLLFFLQQITTHTFWNNVFTVSFLIFMENKEIGCAQALFAIII